MTECLERIKEFCLANKESIAVAESVTAGCIQTILSTANSADAFFQGGITTYNISQKTRHLNIDPIFAESCNAVDDIISIEMAKAACKLFCSSIGIGSTGYALPFPEANVKVPFAFLAIVYKERVLFAEKIIPQSKNYGLDIQQEYAETIITILSEKLSQIEEGKS